MAGAGFRTFVDGDVLTAAQVNTYLMEQAVMVFADSSARTTALPTPSEGMVSYLADTNVLEVYDGSSWVSTDDPNAIQNTIVDAKGDIITATADNTPARLAVGTNEHRLVADSGQTTGLKYVADTTNYAIAAKGDLLVGTAADTVINLGVGTDGYVLTADSGETSGIKWAASTAAGSLVLVATASPSAVSSVTFDNVFTSTYRNYMVVIDLVCNANSALVLNFRTSGVDNTSSSYNYAYLNVDGTTVSGARTTGQTEGRFSPVRTEANGQQVMIYAPQLAKDTCWRAVSSDNADSGTNVTIQDWFGRFNDTTQFDGFKLNVASFTITGHIAVYGIGI
jgi:hypothetical protein